MNTGNIKGVLSFSAFRPEPDDPSASWRRRFPNRKTLLCGLGKASVSWRSLGRNGKLGETETCRSDPKDWALQNGATLREMADDQWCAVSLSSRYVISLETNLSRRPGSEETLKINPRSVLGGRYERGKRYALTHNPDTNSSILLSCDEEQIRKVETFFKEAGLRIGRIACGPYVVLRHLLCQVNNSKDPDRHAGAFLVVCCEGAVCALVQDQNRWVELRSRTDVYEDDPSPVLDLLAPFQQRLAPEMEIVFACDEALPGLGERLAEILPGHPIRDLSEPNLLWNLLTQN